MWFHLSWVEGQETSCRLSTHRPVGPRHGSHRDVGLGAVSSVDTEAHLQGVGTSSDEGDDKPSSSRSLVSGEKEPVGWKMTGRITQ